MEEGEFHLTRLTALWPVIDLLQCPRRAQPALNRLITPDPYPAAGRPIFFYIQHRGPISADRMQQSADLGGRRWDPFPRGLGAVLAGESIPPGEAVSQTPAGH